MHFPVDAIFIWSLSELKWNLFFVQCLFYLELVVCSPDFLPRRVWRLPHVLDACCPDDSEESHLVEFASPISDCDARFFFHKFTCLVIHSGTRTTILTNFIFPLRCDPRWWCCLPWWCRYVLHRWFRELPEVLEPFKATGHVVGGLRVHQLNDLVFNVDLDHWRGFTNKPFAPYILFVIILLTYLLNT